MEIRDPIHGPIDVTPAEKDVLDHPLVQRLRRVRQLGFAEITFPGATHTRFLHSVGALHLAGAAFDAVTPDLAFAPPADLRRARAALRLAALLHDLGHPPFSHSGEGILPPARELGFPEDRPATHEDMTQSLLRHSDVAEVIRRAFRDEGLTEEDVAVVLGDDPPTACDRFRTAGVDLLPLLRQLIAGELDVDRMDYLVRDSYFTGVTYGRFDKDWILSHLGAHVAGDGARGRTANLCLDSQAVFAFEDFLLSRHHMFLMVYNHHRTVVFHRLLARYLEGPAGCEVRVPLDPAGFVACDDEWLRGRLRASLDPFARRLVETRPLKLAVEAWNEEARLLEAARPGLEGVLPPSCEWIDSELEFSRYFPGGERAQDARPLLVRLSHAAARRPVLPVDEYTDLFARHGRRRVLRLYCAEEDLDAATDAVRCVGV